MKHSLSSSFLQGLQGPMLALCLVLAAGASHAQSAQSAQSAAPADEVARGRQLFMANGCFSCHGTVGQGGERSGAPRLAPGPYPFEAFRVLVRQPREAMPRFDARYLSDEQLQAIHRYLSSIEKGPAGAEIPVLSALMR
jgi:ubiquinol-cytochrome c reductase cytochrome c subunit